MYQSPSILQYREQELREWMGPAETNYCGLDSATATPASFLNGKNDITLVLNGALATCPDVSSVQFSLINDAGLRLTTDTFSAASGMISGNDLVYDPYAFGLVPDPGDYTIEVIISDSNGCSSDPVFASFTVL